MTAFLSDLIKLVGSLTPVLGSFLYYIGRRYTESYYETLGVPHGALDFTVADYIFKSIQSWTFLIAAALTFLVFILWRLTIKKPEVEIEVPSQVPRKRSKLKRLAEIILGGVKIIIRSLRQRKGDPARMMIGYFFYLVFGVFLLIVWIIPTAEPNFAAEAVGEIVMLSSLVALAWLIVTDKPTIQYILNRTYLHRAFIAGIVFTVVVSMQLLPHGLGRIVGIHQMAPLRVETMFPNVKISVDRNPGMSKLEWEVKDSIYTTSDKLILILSNDAGMFVKKLIEVEISPEVTIKKLSNTYYIPNRNIVGIDISMPGQFPKVVEEN